MEVDIDKLAKKLNNLKAEPSKDLFDNIYNRYNKKRKNRILFWWFSSFAIVGFIFTFIYFISAENTQVTNTEQTSIQSKILDLNKNKEDYRPSNKNEIQNEHLKIEHNNANFTHDKNAWTQINNKVKGPENDLNYKYSDHQVNNYNDHKKDVYYQNTESKQIVTNINHSPSTAFDFDTVSNLSSIPEDYNLPPLMHKEMSIDFERVFSLPKINILEKKSEIVSVLPTYMIDLYTSSGTQSFCSYARAKKVSFGFGLNYKMYKNMFVRFGGSHSKISYSYDFNTELFNRFGHTDKFPALPLINHRVQNISSTIAYTSFDIGLIANLLNRRKHQIYTSVRQEIIFSSKQQIIYSLTENDQYNYQVSNKNIRSHQLISSVNYHYKIKGQLGLGIQVSYNYSFDYLGVEKERYSGLNVGTYMTYGF